MVKKKFLLCIAALSVVYGITTGVKKVFFPPKQPYVTLTGPIVMADGIGRQLVELASVLMEDFTVHIYPNHVDKIDVPKVVLDKINKHPHKLGKVVISEESLWSPGERISTSLKDVTQENQLRIAYSMLESTRIPPEWVMKLNIYYDMVAVPDPFLVDVYKKSGVQIPVFVLPLGLDLKNFLRSPLKKERNPIMVFANFGSAIDRKNQLLLMRSFAKVLGNVEDAALQINCRNGDEKTKKQLQEEVQKLNCSNIYLTEFKLKNDAYLKLFQGVDCYVSLSKGEGFSIQPREAMALGIPVIATDNTGQTTICNSSLVHVVKSALVESAFYFNRKVGSRFNCEEADVTTALLDVYNNYATHLEKGQQAREWAALYDYSNPDLKALYKSMVKPKKIVLGKKDQIYPDHIETTSPVLYEKYQKITGCDGS